MIIQNQQQIVENIKLKNDGFKIKHTSILSNTHARPIIIASLSLLYDSPAKVTRPKYFGKTFLLLPTPTPWQFHSLDLISSSQHWGPVQQWTAAQNNIQYMKEAKEYRNLTQQVPRQLYPQPRSNSKHQHQPHTPIARRVQIADFQTHSACSQSEVPPRPSEMHNRPVPSPFTVRGRQKSMMETIKHEARSQLQKLSYREKLIQIQYILEQAQYLAAEHGFFFVTLALLEFSFQEEVKVRVKMHPDSRATKPLHPIKKQTQFYCEVACVLELKNIIKILFPTIDLGNGRTFVHTMGYVESLYNDVENKLRRTNDNFVSRQSRQSEAPVSSIKTNKDSVLFVSMKTMPAFECQKLKEAIDEENNRQRFKIDQKHKQTTSTLLDSIRSANSIQEKLRFEVSSFGKSHEKTSVKTETKLPHSLLANPLNNSQKLEPKAKVEQGLKTSSLKQNMRSSKTGLKSSMTGKRLMSMSIEIESEINNLFGSSDDMMLTGFYGKPAESKALRNSTLSKVVEEFEDLF